MTGFHTEHLFYPLTIAWEAERIQGRFGQVCTCNIAVQVNVVMKVCSGVHLSYTLTHLPSSHTHTHTHTRTHARTHTHAHARTCTHAHAHTHTRTRAHAHTHTHTQSLPRSPSPPSPHSSQLETLSISHVWSTLQASLSNISNCII